MGVFVRSMNSRKTSKENLMASDRFVYVTYIRTTPEKLWEALLKPEFTRIYWSGITQVSDWKPGAAWKMVFPDGRVGDVGEILEIERLGGSYFAGGMSFSQSSKPKATLGARWRSRMWRGS
jgi:hypothetical protein